MKTLSVSAKRWLIASLLVVTLCFGMVGTAQAVVIDRDGSLPAGEVVDDDLALVGTSVVVNGTVNGNLVAAGQTVTINGTIKRDVIAAAEVLVIGEKAVIEGNLFNASAEVIVRGKVMGSLFNASANTTLAESASVGFNIYSASYQLETRVGSNVGRDIQSAAYQFIFSGECRNLNLAAAAVELNGMVNGDAVIEMGRMDQSSSMYQPVFGGVRMPPSLPQGLRISPNAKISGKLTYTSSTDQSSSIQAAPAGGVVFRTPVPKADKEHYQPAVAAKMNPFTAGFWLWDMLRNLAALLILGALVLGLAPRLFQRAVDEVRTHSLGSIGIGFVALALSFIAIPLAALVICMFGILFAITTLFEVSGIIFSLGFALLGLVVVLFFTVLFWLGKLAVAFIIGKWVLGKVLPTAAPSRLWSFVTGAVIFALLASIPFAGFLFSFVVALAGLGVVWYMWRNKPAALEP